MDYDRSEFDRAVLLGPIVHLCSSCGSASHLSDNCTAKELLLVLPKSPKELTAELWSSLDQWKRGELMRVDEEKECFLIRKCFPPGRHEFKFKVDRENWRCSSLYPTTGDYPDANNWLKSSSFGLDPFFARTYLPTSQSEIKFVSEVDHQKMRYNVIFVLNFISLNYMLKILRKTSCEKVEIWGSWNNWASPLEVQKEYKSNKSILTCQKVLELGFYTYKFCIDGEFCLDVFRATTKENNFSNHFIDLRNEKEFAPEDSLDLSKPAQFQFVLDQKLTSQKIFGHTISAVGEKFYVFGGVTNGKHWNGIIEIGYYSKEVEINDRWGIDAPRPLSFHTAITFGQKLVFFGAIEDNLVQNYHSYCTIQKNWKIFDIESYQALKRKYFSTASRKGSGRVYFFGGYFLDSKTGAEQNYNNLLMLDVSVLKLSELKMRNKVNPEPRHHHSANMIEYVMYVFGGRQLSNDKVKVFDELLMLDIFDHEKLLWIHLQPEGATPCARFGHASEVIGANLFIFAGDSSADPSKRELLSDLWCFDSRARFWKQITIPEQWKSGRVFSEMAAIDETLLIYGGDFEAEPDSPTEMGALKIKFSF